MTCNTMQYEHSGGHLSQMIFGSLSSKRSQIMLDCTYCIVQPAQLVVETLWQYWRRTLQYHKTQALFTQPYSICSMYLMSCIHTYDTMCRITIAEFIYTIPISAQVYSSIYTDSSCLYITNAYTKVCS